MDNDKKFRSVSISDSDYAEIEDLRKTLIYKWEKEQGVKLNLSIAATIKMATVFYSQRVKAGMVQPEVGKQ